MNRAELRAAVVKALDDHIHLGDIVTDFDGMVDAVLELFPAPDNETAFDKLLGAG